MLQPRIIPCLLIKDNGLVKTVNFKNPTYVGDPINVVKIFNEKEVDELILLDVNSPRDNYEINYELISKIASECRMPLCYGGGIKDIDEIKKIISLGVEKVSICSSLLFNDKLLEDGVKNVGSQSIVACIDIDIVDGNYYAFIKNGTINTKTNPIDLINRYQKNVGEILINFINKDGLMTGYDFNYIKLLASYIPFTVVGGAGFKEDFIKMVKKFKNIGISAGSFFVYKGKYKAVLINYLDKDFKELLFQNSCIKIKHYLLPEELVHLVMQF